MCILRIVETLEGNADASSRWVAAQLNVGIICACLPTLMPALPRNVTIGDTLRSILASLRIASKHGTLRSSSRTQKARIQGSQADRPGHITSCVQGSSDCIDCNQGIKSEDLEYP